MSRIVKWALLALPVILGVGALAGGAGYLYLLQSLPQTEGEIALPALEAPVTVTRDRHGIPTIRAESEADAYRALGFLHAQDRLWQMDFMRRTAQGRLSEVVGQATLGVDRFMRTLGFGRLAARQMQHLDPDTQAALRAYADGVNAFLGTDPVLPLEFHILGYAPERWTPADSLSWIRLMALQLSGNYREEIVRAGLAERLDAAQIDFLYPDYPDNGATTLAGLEGLDTMGRQLAALLPPQLEPKSASNAWVLARRNGRGPILANDPHLGLQVPGYWYLTRIETPRRTLVGATAPGMPFHILGRNDAVAWGLTTTHSDTQDLFLEKLDPDDPSRYATPDGWRSFDTRTETIAIEDAEQPVEMTVRTTRHGPVISDTVEAAGTLAGQNRAVALAWPALTADDGTPDALLAVNRAQSVRAALAAMRDVESPQQNVFLADRAGTIAMIAPARVPIRKAGDGTLPRPGWTGEYDWTGWVPTDRPPQAVNPDGGRLVNGNNRIVDGSYPYLIAAHWPPPWRAERIHALLDAAADPLAMATSETLQLDARSTKAELLLPTLLAYDPTSRAAEAAWRLLDAWDRRMDREAAAPLVFTAWIDHLNRALFADELGSSFEAFARPDPRLIEAALAGRGGWCDDVTTQDLRESCADQVGLALEDALASLETRFGGGLEDWRWGEAHVARFPHPMFSRLPLLGQIFGPELGTDGGDQTVNRGGASYGGGERRRYTHVHGATLRAVHDLSRDPGSSRFMLADGQSGNPLSQHFGSMAEAWRDGRFLKLVGQTQDGGQTLRLTPATR